MGRDPRGAGASVPPEGHTVRKVGWGTSPTASVSGGFFHGCFSSFEFLFAKCLGSAAGRLPVPGRLSPSTLTLFSFLLPLPRPPCQALASVSGSSSFTCTVPTLSLAPGPSLAVCLQQLTGACPEGAVWGHSPPHPVPAPTWSREKPATVKPTREL